MKKDKILHMIDKNKLLEIMSREQMRMAIKRFPFDEWVDGWTDCYNQWLKAVENLSNEAKTQLELRPLLSNQRQKRELSMMS